MLDHVPAAHHPHVGQGPVRMSEALADLAEDEPGDGRQVQRPGIGQR
jgi:hypothetical protein